MPNITRKIPLSLLPNDKSQEHQLACDVWGMLLDHKGHIDQLA